MMCRVLDVSRSGFYAWLQRKPSAQARSDAALKEQIVAIHESSRATYGAPRVHFELKEMGQHVSRKRVARLMRMAGIQGVSRRKGTRTTLRSNREAAPDLVRRDFTASGPDQLWVADMTYIPTWAGFLYLSVVIDVWSRRVVGWSMANHMRQELVLAALDMAAVRRQPIAVIHHSDHGSQYTSLAFGKRCETFGIRVSMGTVGDCYDNAMAESFFATLECELINRRSWRTKTEARMALFSYIEGWYNPRRRHSALGQMSPVNFERKHIDSHRMQATRGVHGLPTVGVCVAGATPPVDNPAPVLLTQT